MKNVTLRICLPLAFALSVGGCGGGGGATSADFSGSPTAEDRNPDLALEARYLATEITPDLDEVQGAWWIQGPGVFNSIDATLSSAGQRQPWHEANPELVNRPVQLRMGALPVASVVKQASRPNFLFVVLDDFGWGYLKDNYANSGRGKGLELIYRDNQAGVSNLHNTMVASAASAMPFVNDMVSNGLRLENLYVTNSLCGPSRAAIVTGIHSARLGLNSNEGVAEHGLPLPSDSVRYMPALLKDLGYKTAAVGKYHAKSQNWALARGDDPISVGYDYFYGFNSHGTTYYESKIISQWSPVRSKYVKAKQKEGVYLTDAFTDAAIEWLNKRTDSEPFYLHLAYNAIHGPLNREAPKIYQKFKTGNNAADLTLSYMKAVDEGLKQVWGKLQEKGLDSNTIMVFVADNGSPGGRSYFLPANSPMRGGKGQQYQGSLKVPAFIYSPNWVAGGRVSSSIRSSTDLATTIMDLAGVPSTELAKLDGRSMRKLLDADTADDGDADVTHPYIMALGHNAGNWAFQYQPDNDGKTAPGAWMVRSQDRVLYFSGKEEYLNYPDQAGPTGAILGLFAWNDWNQATDLKDGEPTTRDAMLRALRDWVVGLPTPSEGCSTYWADVCGSVARDASDVCSATQISNAAKSVLTPGSQTPASTSRRPW